MTGAEFNEAYGKYEMIKILRRDMTHNGYVYKPNSLNKMRHTKLLLRETFDPDPRCRPHGLYFCKAKHLFTFIGTAWDYYYGEPDPFTHGRHVPWMLHKDQPLIAIIKIPAKATVSIGEHKFKTNMMELGEPIELRTYITDEYILKRSRKKINRMYVSCLLMRMHKMADRVYKLAGHKIEPKNICYRLEYANWEKDEFTLRQMLEHLDAKNIGMSNYPRKLRKLLTGCIERTAQWYASIALKCCCEEGVPFNLNNNRLLGMVQGNRSMSTLQYMIEFGFDIDAVDGGPDIFIRDNMQPQFKLAPTILEQYLAEDRTDPPLNRIDPERVRFLIDLGAQISNVSKHVLIGAVSKLDKSDRELISLISKHIK